MDSQRDPEIPWWVYLILAMAGIVWFLAYLIFGGE